VSGHDEVQNSPTTVIDILFVAESVAKRNVRLTQKVWVEKICLEHPELAKRPEYIAEGLCCMNTRKPNLFKDLAFLVIFRKCLKTQAF
jgi:hypothetical protein